MPSLFLTTAEIDELCHPLTQPAAQVRYLRDVLKLTVSTTPAGRPVVVRSHAEAVLSGAPAAPKPEPPSTAAPAPQPNIEGFQKVVHRGKKHGSQKNVQPA